MIKLTPYKTYSQKITLEQQIECGFIPYNSGPRPFQEVPSSLYGLFLKEGDEK